MKCSSTLMRRTVSIVHALVFGGFFIGPSVAVGAEHIISADIGSVNCSVQGIKPGDQIILQGGSRGNLVIEDCFGTVRDKITVRNDSAATERTSIRARGDAGFRGIDCNNCEHLIIDGTGKWSGAPAGICGIDRVTGSEGRSQCGIRIVRESGTPTTLFAFRGSSKNVQVRGVEIDGAGQVSGNAGIGMYVNDRAYSSEANPGEWRENFLIENNYFHDTHHEGLYAGPNFNHEDSVDDLRLRNIEVAYNLVEDTGWGGLQVKTATEGTNSIHHNHFYRAGWLAAKAGDTGHAICTQMDGSVGSIHSNYFEDCGAVAIAFRAQYLPSSFGRLDCRIYNNVISGSGNILPSQGINVWRRSANQASPECIISNNTVVATQGTGILLSSEIVNSVVRDNIVVGSSESDISRNDSTNQRLNNLTGTIDSIAFANVDLRNFRITEKSPAKNSASASGFPNTDFAGVPRPQEGVSDIGAFEYKAGGATSASRPNPPWMLE